MKPSHDRKITTTGGRGATTRHIPPKLALAVGKPTCPAPPGWQWRALDELAKLESGHTPSRRYPEYWGGDVPWISIRDAKAHHGRTIYDTTEKTNELGIKNSSARILPAKTVCLSRTASVGYVVVTGQPMATSQDFVNWICGEELEPEFLQYLLLAEGTDLLRFASGAVHQTIYFPEAKAFYACVPSRAEQQRIVTLLDEAFDGISTAKANAEKNLQNAQNLFLSGYATAFAQSLCDGYERLTVADMAMPVKGSMRTGPFGSQLLHSEFVDQGIAVLGIDNAVNNEFRWDKRRYITEEKYRQLSRYQVKPGDVLITIMGTCGRCAVVPDDIPVAINTKHLCCITLDPEKCSSGFLHGYFLYHPEAQQFLASRAQGSIMAGLNMGIISELPVLLPPLKQQHALVSKIATLRAETQRLESIYQQKLAALDELKQSLLHQAFSGNL